MPHSGLYHRDGVGGTTGDLGYDLDWGSCAEEYGSFAVGLQTVADAAGADAGKEVVAGDDLDTFKRSSLSNWGTNHDIAGQNQRDTTTERKFCTAISNETSGYCN